MKNLVALVALAIVRERYPNWTTASVTQRAGEVSISPERISRLKSVVMPQFESLVATASRPGRRPFRPDIRLA